MCRLVPSSRDQQSKRVDGLAAGIDLVLKDDWVAILSYMSVCYSTSMLTH